MYMAKLLLVSSFLFLNIGAYLCLEFNANGDTVKGATVSLVCSIDPLIFTSPISLIKDGSSMTSCDNGNICNPTSSNAGRYVYSSNSSAVTVTITSLAYASDTGNWSCSIAGSSPEDYPLVVQTEPTVTAFINGSSTAPGASGTKFDSVNLSARSYCFFPIANSAELQYSVGTSGSVTSLTTIPIVGASGNSVGCDAHEFDLQTNVTVDINLSPYRVLSGAADVYFQIIFTNSLRNQFSTGLLLGPYDFKVSTPTPDKCPLFQYAFWPCFCIVLVGTLLVIGVSYHVGKGSKLQEGSLKKSCGCCPSDNTFCMAVCPLCTNLLCTDSKKIAKNVISVIVFLCVAAVIGVIIAFGLGVDSGKCILALILSIVCGLALMAIFTVSVYPHWPCLPEKGEDDSTEPDNPDVIIKPAENPVVTTTPEEGTKSYINCFMPCRVNPSQDTMKTDENNSGKKNPKKKPEGNQASPNRETERKTDENNSGKKNPKREPAENQASPNRETPRSPQASASGIQLTTAEGRSPRPLVKLPAIVNESTLNTKEMGTPLPVPPISKKQLAPVQTIQTEDTRDEEETRKKRKKKKKNKKKEGEENGGDDKRDSQNSGGQANVEEEEQK